MAPPNSVPEANRADLRRLLYRLPLIKAVSDHGVGLVFLRPDTRRVDPPLAGAFVAIVEDRPLLRGPTAFEPLSLRALLGSVQGVVVVCDGAVTWMHHPAAELVRYGVSSLVVETSAELGVAWRAFVHSVAPVLPVRVLQGDGNG